MNTKWKNVLPLCVSAIQAMIQPKVLFVRWSNLVQEVSLGWAVCKLFQDYMHSFLVKKYRQLFPEVLSFIIGNYMRHQIVYTVEFTFTKL